MEDIQILGTANNGKGAIELCSKTSPDFLILDLSMPDFDGFYALDKLREQNNPVKIIILTGLIDEVSQSKLSSYKIFKIFTKPVNPTDLVNAVNS